MKSSKKAAWLNEEKQGASQNTMTGLLLQLGL